MTVVYDSLYSLSAIDISCMAIIIKLVLLTSAPSLERWEMLCMVYRFMLAIIFLL